MASPLEPGGSLIVEIVAGANITDTQASNFFAISGQIVYARSFLVEAAAGVYEEGDAPVGEVLRLDPAPEGGATDPYWPATDVGARTMRLPLLAGVGMLVVQLCNQGTVRDGVIGTLALPLGQDLVDSLGRSLVLPLDSGGTACRMGVAPYA